MPSDIKQRIEARLERIANVLLLNASFIDNLGLLNGKMGIAIFFYRYARYTGNEIYERYAGELIDEIYDEINTNTPVDFANGLTGIGWGIEHLVKNKYIEADTDETLVEIDTIVYQSFIWNPLSITDKNSFFGFGFYCLARLSEVENDNNCLSTLKKKQLLIYLMDECERLLTKELLFNEIQIPNFTLSQVNSITWFILQTHKLGLFLTKSNKLIQQLATYVETRMEKHFENTDSKVFSSLIDQLLVYVHNNELVEKYNVLLKNINNNINSENEELLIHEFIKSAWNPFLYELKLMNPKYFVEEVVDIVDNDKKWEQRLDKLNKYSIGLNNGMAGLGMAFLNEVMEVNEMKLVI